MIEVGSIVTNVGFIQGRSNSNHGVVVDLLADGKIDDYKLSFLNADGEIFPAWRILLVAQAVPVQHLSPAGQQTDVAESTFGTDGNRR